MKRRTLTLVLLLCCAPAPPAGAQSAHGAAAHAHPPAPERPIQIGEMRVPIPDVMVSTHEDRKVRLYTDLVKDKVVLLGFFYTRCTYICGMEGRNLARLQSELGPRLGRDVFMVLISMDPHNDMPENLKSWAESNRLKRGWTLVSSTDAEMIKMIKDFTGNGPGPKEMHTSAVFVGNDRTGVWMGEDGLSEPAELVKALDHVSGEATSSGHGLKRDAAKRPAQPKHVH